MSAGRQEVRFTVSEEGAATVQLSRAILIYATKGGGSFATVHDVAAQPNGAATILPGRPMTAFAVARLAGRLTKRRQGGFIPDRLLYRDSGAVAWWVPPTQRRIWFRCEEGKLGGAERSEVVGHPGLVFCATASRKWYVWAVKGGARPTEGTKLFRAPYFNVWESGQICVGNVDLPERATAEKIEEWNNAFFDSWFTHPNVHQELVHYRGGSYAFWRDMLDGKHPAFPERVLVSLDRSLGEAMQQPKGGRHD
ncbi:PRTRC system protein B [Piscinibacter sp.]|uniref:PRTRC system protein B n=1 Tax=Piscinibacter sp. TaxID=1903157 RepID=UPI0035AE2D03